MARRKKKAVAATEQPPDEQKVAEGEQLEDAPPKEKSTGQQWMEMWETLVGIELHRPVYVHPQTTIRVSKEFKIQPLFFDSGFQGPGAPIGCVVEAFDRRGVKKAIRSFIPANNIKGYQFGERYIELSTTDTPPPAPPPAPVEDDSEVLGEPVRRTPKRKPIRKHVQDMVNDDLEPDEEAIAELAAMEAEIEKSQAEEAAYMAEVTEEDEEVLGDEPEEQ